MTGDEQARRLSGNEIAALRFAARRQLSRWANRRELQAHAQTRRDALVRAVRALENPAYATGCELRAIDDE
jgi:hypothetical protein